jgi:hypothetical protein
MPGSSATRRSGLGVLLVALVGAVAFVATAAADRGHDPGAAARMALRSPGFFRSHCALSHTADDDPILMPRMAGQSMVHDFFGNTTTNAFSTASALRSANTTSCLAPADTAAYWFPALYQHGKKVTPSGMTAYYRTAGRPAASIRPMPQGLQMIAGNEASLTPQPLTVAYWSCGAKAGREDGVKPTSSPPVSCPAGGRMVLSLVFPDCWDGHTLAGATQKNVAYAVAGACPAAYPVAIPEVVAHVSYPILSGAGLTLSMSPTMNTMAGSIYTAHADFVNAWEPTVLARLVATCDDTGTKCGTVGRDNETHGISAAEAARSAKRAR